MRILVSPDSFKGSLMSWDVAAAAAAGARRAAPGAEIVELPVGDGGEGTARALAGAVEGARMVPADVLDPLGRPLVAEFAFLPPATAVVEMAAASGLSLLAPGELDPLRASSFGTGQLLRAALDLLTSCAARPPRPAPAAPDARTEGGRPEPTVILAVGGSATVDGGVGMVSALGGRFLGATGEELGRAGGGGLGRIAKVDLRGLDPRIRFVELVLASDVDSPLLGGQGAAAVFGPQKGAGPAEVELLDRGLAHLREVVLEQTGHRMDGFPGAGAAGGLGAAAVAILGAAARPGIEVALKAVGFERHVPCADLVLTGEGRYDSQTLSGKTVFGVAAAAARHGVPVCVLAGSVDPAAEWRLPGDCVVLPIADGPMSLAESKVRASQLISAAARRAVALFLAAGRLEIESRAGVAPS